MILQYDDGYGSQTIVLDFWGNLKFAQPIIFNKMMAARTKVTANAEKITPSRETTIQKQGGPFNYN